MPAKPWNSGQPTIYLDNSTLCDAFRAHKLGPRKEPILEAYRPLLPWVARVASTANLCMSNAHLAEVARMPDGELADALAHWYDELPVVWLRGMLDAENREDEYWTERAAGVRPSTNPFPFVSSILMSFAEPSINASAAILGSPTPVLALVKAYRLRVALGPTPERTAPLQFADAARATRQRDLAGWSPAQLAERQAQDLRSLIRERAFEADLRLRRRGVLSYAMKACSSGDVQDLLVDVFDRDPRSLPLLRIGEAFTQGFIATARRRRGGSKSERNALSGTMFDRIHAVAAGHCDVFTCDGEVSGWLGDARERLGFARQLSAKGHPGGAAGFVASLMSTVATP